MCLWFYAENAIKQRPQMRSIAQPMQPLTSGLFVHISASKQSFQIVFFVCLCCCCGRFVHSLSFILLLSRGNHYLGSFTLKWLTRCYAMTVEECPHSAKRQRQRITHWKTNDASTTSVNRVTYLLFDEFVLHVVCMSIHFVIKGCVSRHAFCSSSMNQYRTKSSETIAIVNPKCWPHF